MIAIKIAPFNRYRTLDVVRGVALARAEELAFHPDPASPIELERALQELPEDSAEAFLMQVLGGFSCAEIAAALESSEGAIMTRLTRARQALRRRLDPAVATQARQA